MKKIRILIADDHVVVRHGLKLVLRQEPDFEVVAEAENGRARLVVRDNGRGFEPDIALAQEHGQEHFGLRGMQNRAYSLGGTCDIFSQPEAGTSIVIDIPAAWQGNGANG